MQPFRRAGRAALDPETPAPVATCRSDRGRRLHQLLAGRAGRIHGTRSSTIAPSGLGEGKESRKRPRRGKG
nr:hypothetical protein [Pseudomonas aeruginosa]